MRTIGTVVRGIRAPIIRQNDNIARIAADSVMEAWKEAGITPEKLFGRVCYKAHLTENDTPISLVDAISIIMDQL